MICKYCDNYRVPVGWEKCIMCLELDHEVAEDLFPEPIEDYYTFTPNCYPTFKFPESE